MEHNITEYDYLFKILLVGDSGVGKSSLLFRYSDQAFIQNHIPTIGVDFKIRTIVMEGKTIKVQIWDTAGQERFKAISQTFYKGAHGIFLVYDVTNSDSFYNISKWNEDVEKYGTEDVKRVIVGNKSDLFNKMVDFDSGQKVSDALGVPFVETSAKQNCNVDQAFLTMVKGIKQTVEKRINKENTLDVVNVGKGDKNEVISQSCLCV